MTEFSYLCVLSFYCWQIGTFVFVNL